MVNTYEPRVHGGSPKPVPDVLSEIWADCEGCGQVITKAEIFGQLIDPDASLLEAEYVDEVDAAALGCVEGWYHSDCSPAGLSSVTAAEHKRIGSAWKRRTSAQPVTQEKVLDIHRGAQYNQK